MRSVVCLAAILLASCASLLGIENPSSGDAGAGSDSGISSAERLTFSLGDFALAQGQAVRLRVIATFADGGMQDVTTSATYSSDDPNIVAIGAPGQVNGGTQPGTTTITARLGDAMPATVIATVTATTCHPVINELTTGSAASSADEWVEIYNPCTTAIDVGGWTLVYRAAGTNGPDDTSSMIPLDGQMQPGELRLYAGIDYRGDNNGTWPDSSGILQQNQAGVGLRAGPITTGALVDSIAYGSVAPGHPFIETSATPAMANGRSASRLPFDGKDSNNGAADFMIISTPTPRALNAP